MPKIDKISYPNCDQNLEYNTKMAIGVIFYDTLAMALKQYDEHEIKRLKYRPVIDFYLKLNPDFNLTSVGIDFTLASYRKTLPCFEEYFEKNFSQDDIYQAICNSSNYPSYLLTKRRFGKLDLQPQKLFVLKEEIAFKNITLEIWQDYRETMNPDMIIPLYSQTEKAQIYKTALELFNKKIK